MKQLVICAHIIYPFMMPDAKFSLTGPFCSHHGQINPMFSASGNVYDHGASAFQFLIHPRFKSSSTSASPNISAVSFDKYLTEISRRQLKLNVVLEFLCYD